MVESSGARAGRKGRAGQEEGQGVRQWLLTEGSDRKHGQGLTRRFALEFVTERVLRERKFFLKLFLIIRFIFFLCPKQTNILFSLLVGNLKSRASLLR